MKHQKHAVAKHFSWVKIADMKKPTQEKSLAEIIIHMGINDLSSDKDLVDVANDIMQLG